MIATLKKTLGGVPRRAFAHHRTSRMNSPVPGYGLLPPGWRLQASLAAWSLGPGLLKHMIGVIVVTHGQLANELSTRRGPSSRISRSWWRCRSVGMTTRPVAREAIAQAIARVQGPAGVLILTDMFGGTPSNLGLTFLETNRVEVITGVNLPMLIKLAHLQSSADLLAVAREMREIGRNAIWVASDLLHAEAKT
jgi:PTS system mannose-specific IIA component